MSDAYADYQAISKKRISLTLELTEKIAPCIHVDYAFDNFYGSERLNFFEDEIHLSARGNELFAKELADQLVGKPEVVSLFQGTGIGETNPNSQSDVAAIRELVGINPGYIDRLIDKHRFAPGRPSTRFFGLPHSSTSFDIPQTRYTTW